MEDNMSALLDALNNHSVTDENGEVGEEQPQAEEVPPQEQTAEEIEEQPQAEPQPEQETEETNEPEVAEDDSGRKYIPEKRFKEVYAQKKELERKLQQFESAKNVDQAPSPQVQEPNGPTDTETELLLMKFPQFDRQNSQYDETLDAVAAELYKASFRSDSKGKQYATISKLDAARKAIALQSKIAQSVSAVRSDNRTIKVQQSGGSMAQPGRSTEKPVESMSLEEKEAYLKKTGLWDKY